MPAIAAVRDHGDISGYRAFVPKMASKKYDESLPQHR
jgi:hypothetical protein